MGERTEVRFKVYSQSSGLLGAEINLPYNLIDFNVGGGTYDTTNYTYTIPTDGIYLIGATHMKGQNPGSAQTILVINRGTTKREINLTQNTESNVSGLTLTHSTMYQFLAGDIIYVYCPYSYTRVAMNMATYTGEDIKNSFWGIRLDWN
jgi:hypothetical protein